MPIQTLSLSDIRRDPRACSRAVLDEQTIDEYSRAMLEGDRPFPPLIVFDDGDGSLWLADGWLRFNAAMRAGLDNFDCDIRDGTLRTAILLSIEANACHPLKLSNADKRRAVLALLDDREWSTWSDRKIAVKCGVSHTHVANLRRELAGNVASIATEASAPGAEPAQMTITADPPEPPPLANVSLAISRQASAPVAAGNNLSGQGALFQIQHVINSVARLPTSAEIANGLPWEVATFADVEALRRSARHLVELADALDAVRAGIRPDLRATG